jgi:hypothetical protein
MYAPKDKMMARVDQDPDISRPAAVILPVMSYELVGLEYDASRKLETINRNIRPGSAANRLSVQYNPVPYNINFKCYVYVKNAEDGTKIIEQILPYFTPDWTLSINLVPEMSDSRNIPVVISDVAVSDNYDGDFNKRRAIIWEFSLQVKGYMYGPIKQAFPIQFTNTSIIVGDAAANLTPSASFQYYPGLLANGQPTSNASLTIPYQEISITDDYGFISTIMETDV